MEWTLGKFVRTYEGNAEKVRVADVKGIYGIKRRPIHRLAPLIQNEDLQASENCQTTRSSLVDETDNPPSKKLIHYCYAHES